MDPLPEALIAADDLAGECGERLAELAGLLLSVYSRASARCLPWADGVGDQHTRVTRMLAELTRVRRAVAVHATPARRECEEAFV